RDLARVSGRGICRSGVIRRALVPTGSSATSTGRLLPGRCRLLGALSLRGARPIVRRPQDGKNRRDDHHQQEPAGSEPPDVQSPVVVLPCHGLYPFPSGRADAQTKTCRIAEAPVARMQTTAAITSPLNPLTSRPVNDAKAK